jgi:hypothetical protein
MSRGAEGICVELVYDSECPNVNQARTNLALLRPRTFWSHGGAFATAVITLMVC